MKSLKILIFSLLVFCLKLSADSGLELEKITSFGGTLKNMTVVNDELFVSTTDGLKIFDASNKSDIKPLSYLNNLGECSRMDIDGNHLYLINKTEGLIIINISNLKDPFVEGRVSFSEDEVLSERAEANDVKVKDGYAYIAVGKRGLAVVDISSPSSPKILNYFQIEGYTVGIDLKGDYAYVISAIDGLYIIDISNPDKPVLSANLPLEGQCNDIKVDGNYAYIANKNGLDIVDVTEPDKPKLLTSYDTNGYCLALDVKSDKVYVANGTDIEIIDVTNKKSPSLVNKITKTDFYCYGIEVDGDFMYVLNNNKPCVSDISNPYDIKYVSSFDTVSWVRKIKIIGNKAYMANDYNGVEIADLSDIDDVKFLGEYYKDGAANDLELKEDTLFVANHHKGLQILDVSDPASIKYISSLNINGIAKSLFLQDCCVFIAGDEAGLVIADVSDPSSPYVKGVLDTGGNSYDVEVKGDYAFIADGYNGLVIADVSDKSNPVKIARIKLKDFAYALKLRDSYLYVADGEGGLEVIDVSDVFSPKIVGGIDTEGEARDITLWENFAFVSDNDRGLEVVDISDPSGMKIVKKVYTGGKSLSTDRDGNRLFLANFANGVSVFRIVMAPKPVARFEVKEIKSDSVLLEWDLPERDEFSPIEEIKIFRDGILIKTLSKDERSFSDTKLLKDTVYDYEIRLSNIAGDSPSKKISVRTLKSVPIPPTALEALIIDDNTVRLRWRDNSDNEDGFEIYRNGELLYTTQPNETRYTDREAVAGFFYTYLVKAVNDAGSSVPDKVEVRISQTAPMPITDLYGSALSDKEIFLRWKDNSSNEEGFAIYRDGVLIDKVSENVTYYKDKGLLSGKVYEYEVKAFNRKGASAGNSVAVRTFPVLEKAPEPVENLSAQALGVNAVKLRWRSGGGYEYGYEIYRDDILVGRVDYKNDFFIDGGLDANTSYKYRVVAFNKNGKSEPMEVTVKTYENSSKKPKAPLNFKAVANGDKAVFLTWEDNSDNEEGFEIYRNGELIYTTLPDAFFYIDEGLSPATSYEYKIVAVNSAGKSEELFAEATTFYKGNMIYPPTDLKAEISDQKGEIALSWRDNSDNEDGFKIYRDGRLIFIAKRDSTEYVDKGLEKGRFYAYTIKAFNDFGDSIGNGIKVKMERAILQSIIEPPSEFKAEREGILSVRLVWKGGEGDERYKIFRDGELIYTADSKENFYIDRGVEPDREYVYTIVAFNETGESAPLRTSIEFSLNRIQTFVYNLYMKVLERKPDEEGLSYWERELVSKNKSALFVVENFFKSDEFLSKNIDSRQYVKILYETFFNREPELEGLRYWESMIDEKGYPKDVLLYKFAFSTEFKNICEKFDIVNYNDREKTEVFIKRLYLMVLNRPADTESLNYWVDELSSEKREPKDVVKFFFNSEEFKNKRVTNREFVLISYRVILDREPDREGMEYWIGRLEEGLDREKFLDIFLGSQEFETLTKKGFVNEL